MTGKIEALKQKVADLECELDELCEGGDLEDRLDVAYKLDDARTELELQTAEARYA